MARNTENKSTQTTRESQITDEHRKLVGKTCTVTKGRNFEAGTQFEVALVTDARFGPLAWGTVGDRVSRINPDHLKPGKEMTKKRREAVEALVEEARTRLIEGEGRIVHETEKAYKVRFAALGKAFFVPKSKPDMFQVIDDGEPGRIAVAEWKVKAEFGEWALDAIRKHEAGEEAA